MNDTKYIGLDVHQATISVAVLDSAGKLVMEAILETKAETIRPVYSRTARKFARDFGRRNLALSLGACSRQSLATFRASGESQGESGPHHSSDCSIPLSNLPF